MVSTRQSSNMVSHSARVNDNNDGSPSSRRNHGQAQMSNAPSIPESPLVRHLNLLDLPPEIFRKIASYLDYNSIAHLRLICRQMNSACGSILNWTFQRLQTQMLSRFQAIKSQMPRRESARRNHPLACESDIIETLHMRLTLLQMSFGKHIERKHCCFFPGEILDEVYRILEYIRVTPKLAKPYKVTDELFDLSSMAMEYFKEKIEPTLPEIAYFGADFLDLAGTFTSSSSASKPFICLEPASLNGDNSKSNNGGIECSPRLHAPDEPDLLDNNIAPPQSNTVLRKRIRKIKQGMKKYNSQLTFMRRDLRSWKAKIADQQKQIVDYANRLDDNDKKNEETSRKFSTLLQELNKCKTELQYWRSKSPAIPVCNGCGQSMPVANEDFQALTNQNVLPGAFGEALNFIPITDNIDTPTGINQLQLSQQTSGQLAEMAPPKTSCPLIATKRKLLPNDTTSSVDGAKKLRRTAKSRQAKRSKI